MSGISRIALNRSLRSFIYLQRPLPFTPHMLRQHDPNLNRVFKLYYTVLTSFHTNFSSYTLTSVTMFVQSRNFNIANEIRAQASSLPI